ncbi:putative membrane protein DUF2142 [Arthrobacter sp. SLBN-112]|jgi:hypothetical protein|uniref:DUF2142 domain-containing protein n=1 Tax=Arthrobacter sp. SLBN-112 TaxID=2768452 RepID=UPI001153DF39|nr:DUF2142 domain-containing protein [Arthrobacter sp. SLBN-112]TQJ41536.1 putative membrane protein DUF2142 [Arthrobacter sp. SLBN-112]
MSSAKPSGKRREVPRPLRTFLLLTALFTGLLGLWSVATPLMGFPDEPAHTIKAAAVVRGQVVVEEGTSFGHGVHVKVPDYIANLHGQGCYKFNRAQAADCAPPVYSDDTYTNIGVTSAGSYNPMYYWLVGLPTLLMSGAPAIYAMRLISAVLCALFFAAGFTALTELRRPQYAVLLAAVATTPMVLFLGGGINPNSLEIAATLAAFSGFVVVLDNWRNTSAVAPALVAVAAATVVLANARQISLVWLLCALIAGVCSFRFKRTIQVFKDKRVLTAVALAVPGTLAGLYWIYLAAHGPANVGVAPDGIANPHPDAPLYRGFMIMLDRTFDFFPQYIGVMGWLDTPAPELVMLAWGALMIVALILPFCVRPLRSWTGYWVSLAMLYIVPALLQTVLWRSMGFIWQGRYTLPLVVVLLVSVGLGMRRLRFSTAPANAAVARTIFYFVAACHTLTYVYVLRRYVVGISESANWQTLFSSPHWQPPGGWFLLTALYLATASIGLELLFRYLYPGHSLVMRVRARTLANQETDRARTTAVQPEHADTAAG